MLYRVEKEWTALHIAAQEGKLEIIKLLLKNKADIEAKTIDGYTPLHKCSEWQWREMIQILVDNGARIDATTKDGFTALHIAAVVDFEDGLNILLDMGADIEAKEKNVEATPMAFSAMMGKKVATALLVARGAEIKPSYIFLAATRGKFKIAWFLIEKTGWAPTIIASLILGIFMFFVFLIFVGWVLITKTNLIKEISILPLSIR